MSLLRRAAIVVGTMIAAVTVAAAPAAAAPSEQDTTWMVAAHQSNLAEIAAGEAAQQQAATDGVRQMGATLIEDHTALDEDLMAAAQEMGVQLPDAPTPEQQATLEEVAAHQGEDFDTAWIASQIDAHRMSLAMGEQQIAQGQDPTVIALAEAAAPVIQGHLDQLLVMADEHGVPTAVPSGIGDTAPALVGGALTTAGLMALAAALVLAARRRTQV